MSCNTGECETTSASSSLRLVGWLLSIVLLLAAVSDTVSGVSLGGGGSSGEEVVEVVGNERSEGEMKSVQLSPLPGRVKRSRDVQQLCGYRLLDALRSVCDRNFVGFARRSDPSLFLHPGGEGQSGEEGLGVFGNDLNPWEALTLEYPPYSGNVGGGDMLPFTASSTTSTTPTGNFNQGDGGSLLDYWEILQQPSPPSSSSPIWLRNGGGGAGASVNSNKAFALKMLAEPPKTHQRFRRNIIDECCKKPCAMGQMLKYCAITGVGKRATK